MNRWHPPELAVIGMACRFPQASNPQQYWHNLLNGIEAVMEVPAGRWPTNRFFDPRPDQPGKSISKWGAFIDKPYQFDPDFFNISPAEALIIDPQHRLLLELSYECIADAGYTKDELAGKKIGVFMGLSQSVYEEFTRPQLFQSDPSHPAIMADNLRNLAAGRIAEFVRRGAYERSVWHRTSAPRACATSH